MLPHQRGFRTKSPLRDIARRLTGTGVSGTGPTILDVGANRGDRSAEFLAAFPAARVYAVEPHPDTARRLAARFLGEARVRVLPCVLGAETATRHLACYDNSAVNALSPISDAGAHFVEGPIVSLGSVAVPVMRLDDLCAREGIARIDLLKLDAQSHEAEILKGADFFETAALLGAKGFQLFDFYDFAYDSSGQLKWGDALFLPARSAFS